MQGRQMSLAGRAQIVPRGAHIPLGWAPRDTPVSQEQAPKDTQMPHALFALRTHGATGMGTHRCPDTMGMGTQRHPGATGTSTPKCPEAMRMGT